MFFKKTIDSVISDIVTKVEQLHQLAEQHSLKAEFHKAQVYVHSEFQLQETKLKEKAKSIAEKFTALIS